MVDKSIGIYPIADDKINGCCDAGKMSFSISPGVVGTSQSVTPSVKDLSYCYNKNVYFYDASCINKKKSDLTEKTSCIINSQESFDDTMYCWAGESNEPRPVGCTGGSFTAPPANGDYTYYACIDTNGDEIFDKEVQTTLSVISCPDKCEGGFEYRDGSGNPCTYTTKTCMYGCAADNLNCNVGSWCDEKTCTGRLDFGCSGSGTSCTANAKCGYSFPADYPLCTYSDTYRPWACTYTPGQWGCDPNYTCIAGWFNCCTDPVAACVGTTCNIDASRCKYA
jgi:hypothetical protein